MKRRTWSCIVFGAAVALLVAGGHLKAAPVTYDGITFPQGDQSFADAVVSYNPAFSGGNVPTQVGALEPSSALGPPDFEGFSTDTAVSLGSGGRLILQFTDNALTGSGDSSPDLHIFEVGTDVEATFIDISKTGAVWNSVGQVSGSVSSIDIDAFGFGPSDQFFLVRLTDDPNEGFTSGDTVGADIDAVGAISSVPSNGNGVIIPLPAAAWMGLALIGGLPVLRRKMVA